MEDASASSVSQGDSMDPGVSAKTGSVRDSMGNFVEVTGNATVESASVPMAGSVMHAIIPKHAAFRESRAMKCAAMQMG